MAFLDFLFGNSLQKHARRIANRDAQAEDREASAAWLAKEGHPEALVALCERFNLQLDHHLKDKKEKESVIEYLTGHGKAGAEAARAFAAKSANFPWAVKVVEAIEGATEGTHLMLDLLAAEKVEEEFHVEKKRLLLIMLAERKDPRILEAARRFLADYDEGVRNAAVEAIAAQDGDDGRDPLFAILNNPKEESTRIRGRIAEVFATRRWSLQVDDWLPRHIPVGFRLDGDRLVSIGR